MGAFGFGGGSRLRGGRDTGDLEEGRHLRVDSVILNPFCASGRGGERWREVLSTAQAKLLGLPEASLFDAGLVGLADWVRARVGLGARRFAIAGGDGTVHASLNAILAAGLEVAPISFGALGLGSSNDFHKPFGTEGRGFVAGRPLRLDFARAYPHDMGRMESPAEDRFFFANASLGVTAEANDRFNRSSWIRKLNRGSTEAAILAAALATFAGYRNRAVELTVDSGAPFEVALTNLGIVKNRYFSGSFRYDTGPDPDDGWLGVCLCEGMKKGEMLATLAALSRGRFSGRPKTSTALVRGIRARTVDGGPMAIELDGEVFRAPDARFEIREKGIVFCP